MGERQTGVTCLCGLFMGAAGEEKGDDGNRQRRRRKESNLDEQEGGMF